MSDYDSDDDLPFTVDTRGYFCEPEYTEEELLQKKMGWADRERGETSGKVESEARETAQVTWWCRCVSCKPMTTDLENCCCHEWDLVTTQLEDFSETEDVSTSHTVGITNCTEFPALYAAVLWSFFNFLKINWKKRRPEGPDDDLSSKKVFSPHFILLHTDP